MSRSRYTLLIHSLIDSLIDFKKFRDNYRVYLERAHPTFLSTLVVLVLLMQIRECIVLETTFSLYFNLKHCYFWLNLPFFLLNFVNQFRLPVSSDSRKIVTRRRELESGLGTLEEKIRKFSRPKIYLPIEQFEELGIVN